MELKKISQYKIALKWGLIAGGIIILISTLLFIIGIGYKPVGLQQLLNFIVFGAVTALALYKFKIENDGFLSLGKAMLIGLGITIIGSLLIVLWMYIFSAFIDVDFYFEAQKEYNTWNHGLLNPQLTPEEVQADTNAAIDYIRESVYTSLLRGNIILSGIITTLIIGLIMKKKRTNKEI